MYDKLPKQGNFLLFEQLDTSNVKNEQKISIRAKNEQNLVALANTMLFKIFQNSQDKQKISIDYSFFYLKLFSEQLNIPNKESYLNTLNPLIIDQIAIQVVNGYMFRLSQYYIPNVNQVHIIIKMATITQKSKTVQNYILESIKYVNPDQSEIWVAKHKVLNKSYMLKRIKYVKNTNQNIENGEADDQKNAISLQKIFREVQLLKQFKIEGSPKCQKMIKTTNNIYVVSDQFLGTSIYQIFRTHRNAHEQKLSIMIKLAKLLLNFHKQQIIFLQLSPHNIFLHKNQHLFISEWGLTFYKDNDKNIFPVNNTNSSEYFANQVLQESIYSKASDVFSLGKIFSFIYSNTTKNNQFESTKEINSLIERMTDACDKKRPFLEEIIDTLKKIQKSYAQNSRLSQSKKIVRKNVQNQANSFEIRSRKFKFHEKGIRLVPVHQLQNKNHPWISQGSSVLQLEINQQKSGNRLIG